MMMILRQALIRTSPSLLCPVKCRCSISQLSRAHVSYDTSYGDKDIITLKRNFDKADTNIDYHINIFQFNEFIQRTMGRSLDSRELWHLFEEVDKDKDGYISFEEVLSHMENQFRKPKPHRLREVFCLYDKDEDGKIKLDEFREALFHLGFLVSSRREIETFFNKKDYRLRRQITFEEFCEIILEDLPSIIK